MIIRVQICKIKVRSESSNSKVDSKIVLLHISDLGSN